MHSAGFKLEGWSYEATFWTLLGELLGSTIPMDQDPQGPSLGPTSRLGKLAWAWASVFSLSIVGFTIAIMSGPLLAPFEELLEDPPWVLRKYRQWQARRTATVSPLPTTRQSRPRMSMQVARF
mmetsp:Transcript_29462/g.88225  ORF Transcript_29462/g.88225 Transcript_29462/m.88225 type:complete len:123 (+) Transcript_29462:674-1042(+)